MRKSCRPEPGFDPGKGDFVGTFVISTMTYSWHDAGYLKARGKILLSETEGPKFDGSGIGRFRDAIVIIDQDARMMSSDLFADDGSSSRFIQAEHARSRNSISICTAHRNPLR